MIRAFTTIAILTTMASGDILLVPEEYPTIQHAMDSASAGDVIDLANGVWHDQIVWGLSGVTLRGRDGGETIIDGSQQTWSPVVCYGEPTVIENITFQNGQGSDIFGLIRGGAIYIEFADTTIRNCTFQNNSVDISEFDLGAIGGAICNYYGSLIIETCSFKNNTCNGSQEKFGSGGGAIYSIAGELSVVDSTFEQNLSETNGGAINIDLQNNSLITNCDFSLNSAGYLGGAINSQKSNPILSNNYFCNNTYKQIAGKWIDNGGNIMQAKCDACPDINGDGYANISDVLAILNDWNMTNSPADVNGDSIVDIADILEVIAAWGSC